MASLTLNENLFNTVVCKDNGDFGANYFGIFHFRFWHFGKFIDVVVDDQLPTKDGKELIYNKSTDKNEFWSALLEKAYAKLYGGYSNIEGGFSSEAYEDFTGGVVEIYDLKHASVKVFDFIKKSINRNVFFMCAIMNPNYHGGRSGLVDFHAYSITGAITIKLSPKKSVNLLRIYNPWGKREWKGAWSDQSSEWKAIPETYKRKMGIIVNDDGEFWISFEDFKKHFDTLDICNVHPDIEMRQPNPKRKWNVKTFEGSFGDDLTHTVKFTDPDEDDDEDFCTVVIALMQKHTRRHNRHNTKINFIIQAEDGSLVGKTSHGRRDLEMREVCERFELKPGKYRINPKCAHNSNNEYLLRIFYETKQDQIRGSVYNECNNLMKQLQIANENKNVEKQNHVKKSYEPPPALPAKTNRQVPIKTYRKVEREPVDDCGCCIIM